MKGKVLVWSRFGAEADVVWSRATDTFGWMEAVPWPARWDLVDPDGLRRALVGGACVVASGRLRLPGMRLELPVRVVEVTPGLRATLQVEAGPLRGTVLRLRVERAIGGASRLVTEVVVQGASWSARAGAQAVRAWLRQLHRRLDVPASPDTLACARVWMLEGGEAAHGDDPLGTGG